MDHVKLYVLRKVLFFLFWMCASVLLLGYYVVAKAGCNWYLRDINIFSLSEKIVFTTRIQKY
jgi:hypothetical protein